MTVALLVMALLTVPSEWREQAEVDRFELFNDCEPVDLVIEDLPIEATRINLTVPRIRSLAESRLRAARLYDDAAEPYLYINITVTGRASMVLLEFKKLLYDSTSGTSGFAATWRIGGTGTHGGDAGYILQYLSEYVDAFVLGFLRANEDACR